jgi:hypothetical protein
LAEPGGSKLISSGGQRNNFDKWTTSVITRETLINLMVGGCFFFWLFVRRIDGCGKNVLILLFSTVVRRHDIRTNLCCTVRPNLVEIEWMMARVTKEESINAPVDG